MKYDKNTIKEKMTKNNYQSKNQKKIKGEYEVIYGDKSDINKIKNILYK